MSDVLVSGVVPVHVEGETALMHVSLANTSHTLGVCAILLSPTESRDPTFLLPDDVDTSKPHDIILLDACILGCCRLGAKWAIVLTFEEGMKVGPLPVSRTLQLVFDSPVHFFPWYARLIGLCTNAANFAPDKAAKQRKHQDIAVSITRPIVGRGLVCDFVDLFGLMK